MLFGDDLAIVLEREGQPVDTGVPKIVGICIDRLIQVATSNPSSIAAAFERREAPEDKLQLRELATAFRRAHRERTPDTSVEGIDPFVVALALKYFVGKVPGDGVFIPADCRTGQLSAAAAFASLEERRGLTLDIIARLPAPSRSLLRKIVSFLRKLVTLPPAEKDRQAMLRAIVKFWANPLGRPKTAEELRAIAKLLVVLIKGGFSRSSESSPKQQAAAPVAQLQQRKDGGELAEMRGLLNERESALRALEQQRDKLQRKVEELQESNAVLVNLLQNERDRRKRQLKKLLESKGSVRVFARCRGLTKEETKRGDRLVASFPNDETVSIQSPRGDFVHVFDRVFRPEATQEQLFNVLEGLVQSVADGESASIIAYGPSNTGKSFTLFGDEKRPGVLFRSAELFIAIASMDKGSSFEISFSMIELFNGNITDLFADPRTSNRVSLERSPRGFTVSGATSKPLSSVEDVERCWQRGCAVRHATSPDVGLHDSRSHLIVFLAVRSAHRFTGETTVGQLCLCDLAGSENFERPGTGEDQRGSRSIGASLAALGDLLGTLDEGRKPRFQSSKLTALLSECAGGSSKTALIVCLSPTEGCAGETFATLAFARRVKKMKDPMPRVGAKERTSKVEMAVEDHPKQLSEAHRGAPQPESREAWTAEETTGDGGKKFESASKLLSEALLRRKKGLSPRSEQQQQQQQPAPSSSSVPIEKLTSLQKTRAAPKHRRSPSKQSIFVKAELEAKGAVEREAANRESPKQRKVQAGALGVIAAVGLGAGKEGLRKVSTQLADRPAEPSTPFPSSSSPRPLSTTPSKFRLSAQLLESSDVEKWVESPSSGRLQLIHVKGRRHIRCSIVEPTWSSLNSGDSFILDTGPVLFLWHGSHANRMEQAKALDVCTRIKNKDRMTRANIVALKEGAEDPEFWKALGGKHQIPDDAAGGEDDALGSIAEDVLFKVEILEGGITEATEVARNQQVVKELLGTYGTFLLESFNEVYLWQGSKAPPQLRKVSTRLAVQLLRSKQRISSSRVVRVSEGMEPVIFKEKFFGWPDTLMIQGPQPVKSVCTKVDMSFDVAKLLEPGVPSKEPLLDDGNGKVLQIWRMSQFDKVPVPLSAFGQFFSGESYIILYNYQSLHDREQKARTLSPSRTAFFTFELAQTDKGTSACLTIDLDEKYQNEAKQIRVAQNSEPLLFLLVFRGRYIVHAGPCCNEDCSPNGDMQLYHVSSSRTHDIPHPIEVKAAANALNSNDSFILQDRGSQFVWHGRHSPKGTRECAELRALALGGKRTVSRLEEGAEPPEFWSLLGGKDSYFQLVRSPQRFFVCSNSSGRYDAKEVFNFSQEDLVPDDLILLDAGHSIFVWEGPKANKEEKYKTLQVALEFSLLLKAQRGGTPIPTYAVKCFWEPPIFRASFHGFDSSKSKWNKGMNLIHVHELLEELFLRAYSLEELRQKPGHLDQTKLESYLSESDFCAAFEMTRKEFEALSPWKREQAKKRAGLY